MREARRHVAVSIHGAEWSPVRLALLALTVLTALAFLAAAPAQASLGYELNATTPSKDLGESLPHGIAVDQANQRIYVALTLTNVTTASTDLGEAEPGMISRFESNLAAAGVFTAGTDPYYSGVAVNPVTQGFYAAQARINAPSGAIGVSKMDVFSSSGTPSTPFTLSENETLPQIATDSAGNVYYPNPAKHSVQVFNSAGTLQEEISCAGCSGGSFGKPVSVALNSEDDLYVADLAPDRVVKLTSSGGSYSFDSLLQSGRSAAAVGVDPSGGEVLVGDLPGGKRYHIVAYDSSGVQFDDFGAGMFTDPNPLVGAVLAQQIAVDETTHRVYVGDAGKFFIFDKVTIDPPTATIKSATEVGQVTATQNSTINASGHAVVECKFEYVNHADFLANGFANATALSCPQKPDGTSNTTVGAKTSGLSPGTVYHYRVTAANNAGSVTSGTTTFETLPSVPPTVTTEPPSAVTKASATLSAKVNPHGASISDCHFEYGTSVSYGSSLSCASLPKPVTTDVAQSRSVLGLLAGTTYHYRLVVNSNAGVVSGNDVEFTTTSPPVSPPVTEPLPEVPPLPITLPETTRPQPQPQPLRCKKGFKKKRVRGKLRCVKKKRHAKRRRAQGGSQSR